MMKKNTCRDTLERLRAVDFAIQETVLFLDAYPENRTALQFYGELVKERKSLCEIYERECGPLTIYGNEDTTAWKWTRTPWPWESANDAKEETDRVDL